ncbi:NUDIX hydrolase [Arenivirga flava]|uniref:ADP-ribose pyrophosphatase n=1 Tax=Arenivirga flava TaxID=1930060 RepID=A0AA37UVL8_9MICO|nr:NUDIX domain-containing protein [Arenivirga flava]GMA29347.1 ADP-ribose pyrophosphatase [Arenivirga flava]
MTPGPAASRVVAAGAVCWREVDGEVQVLLISRHRHGDVSLPKGKVDPGETPPVTAVREVAEETGFAVHLGAPLGVSEYLLPGGRPKIVHYWAAEVPARQAAKPFVPNDEVESMTWAPIVEAKAQLTYGHDGEILDRFASLIRRGALRTFALVLLRHGTAVPHGSAATDAARTLASRGLEQARGMAEVVSAWGPERLISSTAVRCLSTIAPLAQRTGLKVKRSEEISQDAYEEGVADIDGVVEKRLDRAVTAVLCSHGPVIPEILREIAESTGGAFSGDLRAASGLHTGEAVVVHLARSAPRSGVIAVETHRSA